jgi:hypothetical protein
MLVDNDTTLRTQIMQLSSDLQKSQADYLDLQKDYNDLVLDYNTTRNTMDNVQDNLKSQQREFDQELAAMSLCMGDLQSKIDAIIAEKHLQEQEITRLEQLLEDQM